MINNRKILKILISKLLVIDSIWHFRLLYFHPFELELIIFIVYLLFQLKNVQQQLQKRVEKSRNLDKINLDEINKIQVK